jgi:hypothetical protein
MSTLHKINERLQNENNALSAKVLMLMAELQDERAKVHRLSLKLDDLDTEGTVRAVEFLRDKLRRCHEILQEQNPDLGPDRHLKSAKQLGGAEGDQTQHQRNEYDESEESVLLWEDSEEPDSGPRA